MRTNYYLPLGAFLFAAALVCPALYSAPFALSLDHEDGVYAKNEPVSLYIETDEPQKDSLDQLHLKVLFNHNTVVRELELPYPKTGEPLYQLKHPQSGSLIFEVTAGEATEKVGAILSPHELQPGFTRPSDFEAFWANQKQELANLPLEVEQNKLELEDSDSGYVAYDVEINAPGPRPARGILAKPKNAPEGSLPIVLLLRAAGVKGDWCRSHLSEALSNAHRGQGAISFDLNAHGMLNHEPEAYYEELENGPLQNYWEIGIESRDSYYFRFMYLRMLRSIEFLTQQPEWDGKRLLVIGESQGGGQALAAVGLDPRVSAAVVTVPALCDFGAPLVERKGGWPQPLDSRLDNAAAKAALPYFDAAMLLQNTHATIVAEIGLIDQTCPSTSIFAALNQTTGTVTTLPVTYRAHPWPEGDKRKRWDKTIAARKNEFIENYLK